MRERPEVTVGSVQDPGIDGDRVLRWPVFTEDGGRIGEVSEVRGGCFRVATSKAPDFGLSADAVASTMGGRITLTVATDALEGAKLDDDAPRRRESEGQQNISGDTDLDPAIVERIRTGWPIYTRDGERIGDVEAVSGQSVQVNPSIGSDYWLSAHAIHSTAGRQVTLRVDRDELEQYKQQRPERRR